MTEGCPQTPAFRRPSGDGNIELAIVSDAGYLEPIGVMLHSILRWHPPDTLRIHWVHVRMDRQARDAAAELCRAAGLRTNLVPGDSVLADAGWPADVHPTVLKIFLPEILADVGERLLYLDGDLVVEGPLWPLWRIDFHEGALAGVRDSWVGSPGFWSAFPRSAEVAHDLWMRPDYINAGVLMYDIARCRALEVASKCTRWLTDNPGAHFLEQDALNATLAGALVLAPPAWNVLGSPDNYLREPQARSGYSADELLEAYRNPQIVHFAGPQKPWRDAPHWPPLSPHYFRVRRHTPWHRRLTTVEHLYLTALEIAYRAQCQRQRRAAGAILYAGRVMLSIRRRLRRSLGAQDAQC